MHRFSAVQTDAHLMVWASCALALPCRRIGPGAPDPCTTEFKCIHPQSCVGVCCNAKRTVVARRLIPRPFSTASGERRPRLLWVKMREARREQSGSAFGWITNKQRTSHTGSSSRSCAVPCAWPSSRSRRQSSNRPPIEPSTPLLSAYGCRRE